MNLNRNYLRLSDTDPAAIIEKRVSDHQFSNPDTVILRMDAEDAPCRPPQCVIRAMEEANEQLASDPALRRVPPCNGYPFLLQAIREYYARKDIQLFDTEIFVSNGGKCDITGILELFDENNTVLIAEPFHPIYYDANLASGRNIRFVGGDKDKGYLPFPDEEHADIVYLCSPCNPTGSALPEGLLKKWVDYALFHNALIIYDASYESFIRSEKCPSSIYSIEGAKKCAVEICSLSKSAGFANARLGYTVIPNNLIVDSVRLNQLWMRRERLRFNGVSYAVQKGAAAALSEEGQEAIRITTDLYLHNTELLFRVLYKKGLCENLAVQAPHLWFECPDAISSWECFDRLLSESGIVAIPGSIFGSKGEGHMKITGYNSGENVLLAAKRLDALFPDKETR